MRKSMIATGLIVAALGVTVCACVVDTPTQAAKGAACFMPDDVRNWRTGGPSVLNVSVGGRGDVYTMSMLGAGCDQADWSSSLGIVPKFSFRVCEGGDATIVVPQDSSRPATCLASKIRKLTPEEVAALPRNNKP